MSKLLPKSRIIKVEMMIALPISATMDEIDEWLAFELAHRGGMSVDNPLTDHEPSAINNVFLTDTGQHLHEEVTPGDEPGSYTIKKFVSDKPNWGKTVTEKIIKGEL